MVLAKDEELLKEWEYATSTMKSVKTTHSLVITNKRIISKTVSKRANVHRELAIKDVKSFSCGHTTKSKKDAIILMVLGVLLIVAPIIVFFKTEIGPASFIVCLLGLILFIMGLKNLGQGVFALEIYTRGIEGGTLEIGVVHMYRTIFKPLFSGKLKIKMNNEVAEEIVEVLGSLILT